jgi:hypothetical protein
LAFTDDAGTDIVGIGKYQYDIRVSNYHSTSTAVFIPLAGYVIERTSTAGQNEYLGLLAPYNGTLESVHFRSEISQDGLARIVINEASDGTEVPGTVTGRWDPDIDAVADDTTIVWDLNTLSASTGNNVITKGRLYIIKIQTPSASNDTNVTTVWKWDVTS